MRVTLRGDGFIDVYFPVFAFAGLSNHVCYTPVLQSDHPFYYLHRVIVGRRLKQRRVEALGLFPKARVVRGIDWSWGNQDCVSPLTSGGNGSLLMGASGSALSCRALVRANGEDSSSGPILLPTQGRVTDRRDWYPGAPRSAALVAWDSGAYNVYRVGYAGMVDLKVSVIYFWVYHCACHY